MQIPLIPPDEKTRLDTLRALNILDSAPQERFDRVARLARRLFGVPIALVSLIDADRQWFLSAFGIEVKESSRDISFCGHAILGDEIFTIPDTALDPRFNDNPMVTDSPNIRFYAGCPIKVSNGSKLGTICVIDQSPRNFSDDDKELLQDLARMVEQEVGAIQLATLDELTLISNRRGFQALSKHALSLCKRMSIPSCLLFIDLNNFKHINDQYGHAEGDHALQVFSHILRDNYRESDVIGRMGGDEFAVLLTRCSLSECQINLNRLLDSVNNYNQKATRGYNIELSAGFVEYDSQKHSSIDDMLNEADNLMYEQKKLASI